MVPGADDGGALDIQRTNLFADTGNFRHRTLAEKGIDQRLRLVEKRHFSNSLALEIETFVEGQTRGGDHGVDRGQRRILPSPDFLCRFATQQFEHQPATCAVCRRDRALL